VGIVALCGYILSIVAGVLLYKNSKKGVFLSLLLQIIQIPRISILGFSYYFFSGVAFSLSLPKLSINLSKFNIFYSSRDISFSLSVGLMALILAVFLAVKYKKLK
jgi:hypothetical protein